MSFYSLVDKLFLMIAFYSVDNLFLVCFLFIHIALLKKVIHNKTGVNSYYEFTPVFHNLYSVLIFL